MIEFFKSDKLSIFFSDTPHVCVRYILPTSTLLEKQSIKRFPFINKTEIKVDLFNHVKNKHYTFTIPKGYCYDGASIPRIFWRVIGSPTDNNFLIAALIHDVLCENHSYIENDREFSTEVFNALLEEADVNKFKRYLMKHSVNVFQKCFCNWESKK